MKSLLTVFLVSASLWAQAPTSALAQDLKIAGRVTTPQGEPILGAIVSLITKANSPGQPTTTVTVETDATGGFAFVHPKPSAYYIRADKVGYIRGGSAYQQLNLSNFPVIGLTMELIRQAAISGRIADEKGDPLSQMSVTMYRRMYEEGHWVFEGVALSKESMSSTNGSFSIEGLSPGSYYLGAKESVLPGVYLNPKAPSAEAYVKTYYPSTTSLDHAVPITVDSSQDVRGIEIRVRKEKLYTVTGKVVAQLRPPHGRITLTAELDHRVISREEPLNAQLRTDGSFLLNRVPAGTYMMELIDSPPGTTVPTTLGLLSRSSTDGPILIGSRSLTVKDQDLVDVELKAAPAPVIQGSLKQGMSKPDTPSSHANAREDQPKITFEPRDGRSPSYNYVSGDTFVQSIAPGNYNLYVWLPEGYVKRVLYGGEDITNKPLTVGLNDLTLELEVAHDSGSVSASVTDAKGLPASGIFLSIWSSTTTSYSAIHHNQRTIEGGVATFEKLPPGEYYVAAWATSLVPFDTPEFLKQFEASALKVKLVPNGSERISLKAIPRADIEAALEKLP